MKNPLPKDIDPVDVAVFLEDADPKELFYAANAINKYDSLVATLKEVQWNGGYDSMGYGICPLCGAVQPEGHTVACELSALLAEEEKA